MGIIASSPTLEQRLAARDRAGQSPVMYQSWRNLLFLHWQFDAEAVQKLLPPGLTVDVHEGRAYVGIVPFYMCDVRPRFLPCAPYLSNFLELNVRTYVYDADGVPGVWFFSLDANRAPAVWAGRKFFKLPYRRARMRARSSVDGWVEYSSDCPAGSYASEFHYRAVGEPREATQGSLEFFLLERYYLYAHDEGRDCLYRGQVSHAPYQFAEAEVSKFSADPMIGQGLVPRELGPAAQFHHACIARDVEVEILGIRAV